MTIMNEQISTKSSTFSKMEWFAQTKREIALKPFAVQMVFLEAGWLKEAVLWTRWPGGSRGMVPLPWPLQGWGRTLCVTPSSCPQQPV